MSQTISGFSPTTKLSGGHNGLIFTKGSTSNATINGTGLTNGLAVTVLFPRQSPNPHIKWTGVTANTNAGGTQCTAALIEQLVNNGPHAGTKGDDPVTVSVTVGDATTDSNIQTGTAPP